MIKYGCLRRRSFVWQCWCGGVASVGNWCPDGCGCNSSEIFPKNIFDVEKIMSYVGKIIFDVIQTTSDIIFTPCNTLKTKRLPSKWRNNVTRWFADGCIGFENGVKKATPWCMHGVACVGMFYMLHYEFKQEVSHIV